MVNVSTTQAVHHDLKLLLELAPAFEKIEGFDFFSEMAASYDKLLCQPVNELLRSLDPEVFIFVYVRIVPFFSGLILNFVEISGNPDSGV